MKKYLFNPSISITGFLMLLVLISSSLNAQDSLLVKRLQTHVEILASDSLEGRGLGTKTVVQAREYIVKEFKSAGIQPFQGEYEYPFNFKVSFARVEGVNLIGVIEGSDSVLKNEFIVLGAHYDHLGYSNKNGEKIIFNGADDNASGTAGIIEVARIINAQSELPKRSILFIAFDAEESGLIGSRKLFLDSILSNLNMKFMFSLDMIGMYSKNGGIDLKGLESLENGSLFVESSLKEKNINIRKMSGSIEQRTDTKSFGDKGIPSVHVFTGTKSPYHKPEDDSDQLDYEGMADIVEYTAILAQNIANEEVLLPTDKLIKYAAKTEQETKTIQFGVRANVGSCFHSYSSEFYKAKSVSATQVGLFSKIRVNKMLLFQPEVLFAYEGSKHDLGDLRTQSVTVPVNIVIGTPDTKQGRFFVLAGGYYTYSFSGNIADTKLTFEDDYNQQNWGLNYGFGMEVSNIQVGMFFKSGLSDLGLENVNGEVSERAAYFSLGYTF